MRDLIKLSRNRPPGYLPHGLRFTLSKLHKIDDHLYSFRIIHPDYKYLYFNLVSSMTRNHVHYTEIHLYDAMVKEENEITSQDFRDGIVKGGSIKLWYYRPIQDVILRIVNLKYEEQVLIIADIGEDLWEYEE